jgi:hypothetical protein
VSPEDAAHVSKPELPWSRSSLSFITVLNLAGFPFGGSGVLCS